MPVDKEIIERINNKNLTIGTLLDYINEKYSNDEAIVFGQIRKTWQEFHTDVMNFTAGLHKLGFHKDDKIAVWSQNRYEWMICWFALLKLGIVLIPMDHWYKPYEAQYILHHSDSVAVICTSRYIPTLDKLKSELPKLQKIIIMDNIPENAADRKEIVLMEEVSDLGKEENMKEIYELQETIDKHDTAFILYTSGTTGQPKGAQLSHLNIIKNMIQTSINMRNVHEDKLIIPVPFSHVFGCVVGITLSTLTGSTMLPLMDQTPSIALETITREKATILHGTPTHFIRYIREKQSNPKYDVSSLRSGMISGAPCPPETMRGILDILTMPDIVIGYGETEVSPFCTMTTPDDDFKYRVGSVGRQLPEMEIKIVDDDNNRLGIHEKGEICVRGYNVTKGYYKEPEMTKQAIDEEGFIHTGDLGDVDENGYYRILGRKKDMIIYGGANVYPKQIEDYLLQHPKILEVSVVGVPDPEYGEVVCAVIKRKEEELTEQAIIDYCYGKIQSPSVPRYVRFDVEIPLSGRGKVQKYKLRDTLADMMKAGKFGDKLVPTKVKNRKK